MSSHDRSLGCLLSSILRKTFCENGILGQNREPRDASFEISALQVREVGSLIPKASFCHNSCFNEVKAEAKKENTKPVADGQRKGDEITKK